MISENKMASMADDQYVITRLDSFNTWPWSLSLLVIIGIGYFFNLYDVLTLGVAAPYMGPALGVSPVTLSSIGSMVVLIGYVVGALLYAHISDTVGRKTGLLITLLTFSVGSILTAVSTSALEAYIWRFISGLGIGAELSIASAYLSEMAPASVRGRFQSLGTFIGFIGAGIGPLMGYFIIPAFPWGWRLFFVIGGLGAVTAVFFRWWVPESPRWLVHKGRVADAKRIVEGLESRWRALRGALPQLPQLQAEVRRYERIPVVELLTSRKYAYRVLFVLLVYLLYYAFAYPFLGLTASLLHASGMTAIASLYIVGFGGLGYAIGAFLTAVFADKLERKNLIAIGLVLQGIGLLAIGLKISVAEVLGAYFLSALANTFLVTGLYVYMAEVFPAGARSMGGALTDGLGHLAPEISIPVAVAIFASYALFGTFAFLAVLSFVTAAVIVLGMRTTKRVLETLE